MSSPEEKPEGKKETSCDEIVPPPIMPKPDLKDGTKEGPTYGSSDREKTKDKKDRSRSHPLDPYEPLKKRRGCGGFFGCLFVGFGIVALFFLILAVAVAWMGPGRHLVGDKEIVFLSDSETQITTSPKRPTCYIGENIEFSAQTTETSIAIIGLDVTVSGEFQKDVSVTAAKFKAYSSTRILGNLEVFVAEFYDDGIELHGELSGSVMKNMHP